MINFKNTFISPNSSLEDAIKALDDTGIGILLVVNDQNKLEGTITDGDIRRGLLNHKSMQAPVTKIMNFRPKVADEKWSNAHIRNFMDAYSLLHMPIVDSNLNVTGLTSLKELTKKKRHLNPVFLMAGGFGERLKSLTNNCPKPMLRIGSKPMLEHIMQRFIDVGFYRFYISTHYMHEVIKNHFGDGEKWGVEIKYVHESKPLGTAGALGLLPKNEIDDPLFMINGDVLSNVDLLSFLNFHTERNEAATMGVRKYEYQVPFGVISTDGANVKSIDEKPSYSCFVNAGMYILCPDLVKNVSTNIKIDMPTLLKSEIGKGNNVAMFPLHESWLDVGRPEDFKRALSDDDFTQGEL
jgi:dTDP-glucose pyrophosphorylase/CBS domain-containing protein